MAQNRDEIKGERGEAALLNPSGAQASALDSQRFPSIDRITPTQRPVGRMVMKQQWRDLLFLHWEVPVEQLRPLIPAEVTLDTHEGKAYVGLVPFTMRNVRPVWAPSVPPLSNFHETNVRTYVHYQGRAPGVWFFSLDAANAVAVRLARVWFKLPYFYARMSLNREEGKGEEDKGMAESAIHYPLSTIHYLTERLWPAPIPARCDVRWTPEGGERHAVPGTLEHFLIERYILYAYRNGQLYSGQVHHTPYPVRDAMVHKLEENLIAQVGITRAATPPPLIHCSRGVDVDIYPLQKVKR